MKGLVCLGTKHCNVYFTRFVLLIASFSSRLSHSSGCDVQKA